MARVRRSDMSAPVPPKYVERKVRTAAERAAERVTKISAQPVTAIDFRMGVVLEAEKQLHAAYLDEKHWSPVSLPHANGVSVSSQVRGGTTVYKGCVEVAGSSHEVWSLLTAPGATWNKNLHSSSILEKIDSDTEIVYLTSLPQLNNLISARDFIIVRRRSHKGDLFLLSYVATESPHVGAKQQKGAVRGKHGPSGLVVQPLGVSMCRVCWVMNTHLGGSLPEWITSGPLCQAVVDGLHSIRSMIQNKKK